MLSESTQNIQSDGQTYLLANSSTVGESINFSNVLEKELNAEFTEAHFEPFVADIQPAAARGWGLPERPMAPGLMFDEKGYIRFLNQLPTAAEMSDDMIERQLSSLSDDHLRAFFDGLDFKRTEELSRDQLLDTIKSFIDFDRERLSARI